MRYSDIPEFRTIAIFWWSNDVSFQYSERALWYSDISIFVPEYRNIGIFRYSGSPKNQNIGILWYYHIPIFQSSEMSNSEMSRKFEIYIVPEFRNSGKLVKWRDIPIFQHSDILEFRKCRIIWKIGISEYSDIPILRYSSFAKFRNIGITQLTSDFFFFQTSPHWEPIFIKN